MMKFMNFLHRQEGMSKEEFLDYWRNHHAPLVRGYADAIKMRAYIQVHPGYPKAVDAINGPRGFGEGIDVEFDGVVECWWDSEEEFFAGMESEEGKAAWAAISADEPNFSDYRFGYTYIGNEVEIFDNRQK
jgi:uncharacterized protein (TIGR02118 family)